MHRRQIHSELEHRPALHVEQVAKSYVAPSGTIDVLRGIDLHLKPGETLALTGESGSGKSTLLHLIAGLDVADRGCITVGDTTVTDASDQARAALRLCQIGIVFQQFNLIPSLTVGDNIAFQARLSGRLDGPWIDELTGETGPRWTGAALSRAIVRRPAAAGRDCAGSGGEADASSCGRAHGQSRRGRPAIAWSISPSIWWPAPAVSF